MDNTELHPRLLAVLLAGHAAQDDAAMHDRLLADPDIAILMTMLIKQVSQKIASDSANEQPSASNDGRPPAPATLAGSKGILPETTGIITDQAESGETLAGAGNDAVAQPAAPSVYPWLPLAFYSVASLSGQASREPASAQIPPATSPAPAPQTVTATQQAPLPLRPGQIPSASVVTPASPLPPMPRAKITLPNARAGTPFNALVEVQLDNGERAIVDDITFPGDIGLGFDCASGMLSGTPTVSGDITLLVHWRWRDRLASPQPQLFIINPDPRSLWKIIEPPADDRYFKCHIDYQQIVDGELRMAAASRRGRSHEHVGSFRDDDFYLQHCADSGWSIMLVADGAGSAKNSRRGSQIVTRCVGEHLLALLSSEQGQTLRQQVQNWGDDDKQAAGALFIRQFHQASIAAVNALTSEANQLNESVKSYSTTLLATVSLRCGDELFAAAFWMGDGAIAAYGPAGKVRVLGTPDSGEYAGQTRFLDAEIVADPDFSKRISIGKWPQISHLLLMTDGVSDPWFETDNGLRHADKWDRLVAEIAPCLADEAQAAEKLAEWLNFFSPGNHDDRTLAVSW